LKVFVPAVKVEPSARLVKVPAIGVAAVLLTAVKTVPAVRVPVPIFLKEKRAPGLMVTPLATT